MNVIKPDSLEIKGVTKERLEYISGLKAVDHPVAIMPEVHYKDKYAAPTGITVLSGSHIMPNMVALVPNCGMSMIKTDLKDRDIDKDTMKDIYAALLKHITIRADRESIGLSEDEVLDIFLNGGKWAVENLNVPKEYLNYMEAKGCLDVGCGKDELSRNIPEVCFKLARLGLDYMGGGSHFIETQKIDEIYDTEVAGKWGIDKGQIVFMVHSDSGLPGGMMNRYYTPLKMGITSGDIKFRIKQFQYHLQSGLQALELMRFMFDMGNEGHIAAIRADSKMGKRYVSAHNAVSNFGYVKRLSLIMHMQNAMLEAFGSRKVEFSMLRDVAHNLIKEENYDNLNLWFHRHGCASIYPQSRLKSDSQFKNTGTPVFLPGSLNSHTFLCSAKEGSANYYYSSCHGSGEDTGSKEKNRENESYPMIFSGSGKDINFYRKDKFNNVDGIMSILKEENIAEPVAKIMPLAVLKE